MTRSSTLGFDCFRRLSSARHADQLLSISSLDGRYARQVNELRPFYSEYGLIAHRVKVEVAWLVKMSRTSGFPELPPFTAASEAWLSNIVEQFSADDAARVKEIEAETNHDLKAVEYFLKEKLQASHHDDLRAAGEWLHFACTSEDVNNLAYGSLLARSRHQVLAPSMQQLVGDVARLAEEESGTAMIGRTHGQPATPTTLGKEMANFAYRLDRQLSRFLAVPITGKFNGATGNYSAHVTAYPRVDWLDVSRSFVEEDLSLSWNPYTTQIEPHDCIAELADAVARFNTILLGFNRDVWTYISMGYFVQRVVGNEVGSSTMPHKVNPIDFENSEGNIGIANALLRHFSDKLPVSRLQRDLSDSTVLRNLGAGLGHSLIAYRSTIRGVKKLSGSNKQLLLNELDENWALLAEPIQTLMRKYRVPNAYEQLKKLTRGRQVDRDTIREFVVGLKGYIPDEEVQALLELKPSNYLGLAERLASDVRSNLTTISSTSQTR